MIILILIIYSICYVESKLFVSKLLLIIKCRGLGEQLGDGWRNGLFWQIRGRQAGSNRLRWHTYFQCERHSSHSISVRPPYVASELIMNSNSVDLNSGNRKSWKTCPAPPALFRHTTPGDARPRHLSFCTWTASPLVSCPPRV